jgi:catechol 2,3-dioxygenase-like lactoylglutathione lyase family enzyme
MSYVALITDRFEAMVGFYRDRLGFAETAAWDRPGARGLRLDLDGLRLEIMDNRRESAPATLGPDAGGRVNIVVEVGDVSAAHARVRGAGVDAGAVQDTSWGARLFGLRDPDGTPVVFLQWTAGPVAPAGPAIAPDSGATGQ